MKYFKWLSVAFLFICMILISPIVNAQSVVHASSPPILKINQYYILFTYPTSPYLDQNNRLLVPLRSLSDLLGADVVYNKDKKQATINFNNHHLVLTTGSKEVTIDQNIEQMDTIPVQKRNALYIPLKVMLEYLDVDGAYNANTKIIELNNPKYMKNTPQLTQETQDRVELDENQNAFQVTSYQINLGATDKKAGIWRGSITYTSKNVTGKTIEQGREDVHSSYMLANGNSQGELYKYMREKHSAVKPGESITKTRTLIGNTDLAYIIVKPYAVK